MQKGQVLVWLILGILILGIVAGGAYYLGKTQSPKTSSQESIVTSQTPKSFPSVIPSPSDKESSWQNYESGQNLDGITINYPKDWQVNFRKEYNLGSDYKAKYRLAFDFAPSGWNSSGSVNWMGWGILGFDVYDPQASIDQWISKYSPDSRNNLTVKEGVRVGDQIIDGAKVGGKPTFQIESNASQFGALAIFGSNYTYDLSHSQSGSDEFVQDWTTKTGIFQYISIN